MIQAKDAFLDGDEFVFQKHENGVVQLSFGATHICLSLDSAYDLQYSLAAFLAQLELKDYEACESQDNLRGGSISEGETYLRFLSHVKRQ